MQKELQFHISRMEEFDYEIAKIAPKSAPKDIESDKTGETRRHFLKRMLTVIPFMVPQTYQLAYFAAKGFPHRERNHINPMISAERIDTDLVVSANIPQLQRLAQESTYREEVFFTEQDTPSAHILEGYYTIFGTASIAAGQLLEHTNDLRRQMSNGTVAESDLSHEQRRLLNLRAAYDQSEIPNIPFESEDFIGAFNQLLNNYRDEEITEGFVGIVAAKSPADFGRTGYVRVWNPVSEEWSTAGCVIVLNTANRRTLRNLSQHAIPFSDTNAAFPWRLELSSEVIAAAGLSQGWTLNRSGFLQYIDDEIDENTLIQFPHYPREILAINPGFSDLGQRVSDLLADEATNQIVLNHYQHVETLLREDPDAQFQYQATTDVGNIYTYDQSFNTHTSLAYTFLQQSLPLFRDINLDQFKRAILNETDEIASGIPLGNYSQQALFTFWERSGSLSKKIFSNSRTDSLDEVNAGVFFVEELSPTDGTVVSLNGFLITHEGRSQFVYFDEANQLQRKSTADIAELYTGNLDKRIVIFHPNQV